VKNKLRLTYALILAFLVIGIAPVVNTSATQDQPTIAKDSIQIRAFTFNVYKGNYDVWSWVPEMKFRVNGPIASGSRHVEQDRLANRSVLRQPTKRIHTLIHPQ
jgi:hypothetical protein